MDRLLVFVAAVVPAMLILSYGAVKARGSWSSEPLWNALLMGGVAAIGCIFVELALSYLLTSAALSPLMEAASKALFIAAIPEESAKFIILLGVAERHVDARRKQDILLCALGVSLGFAALENLFYVASEADWHFVAAGRAVLAVPGHGMYGLIMGALLTATRLRLKNFHIALALLVPILLHAAYDFPLFVLKSGFQLWALITWFVVLLVCAAAATFLCNRIMPIAIKADRLSGVDVRAEGSQRGLATGILLVIAGPALAAVTIFAKFHDFAWIAPVVAIFPLALGLDLLWSAWRGRASG